MAFSKVFLYSFGRILLKILLSSIWFLFVKVLLTFQEQEQDSNSNEDSTVHVFRSTFQTLIWQLFDPGLQEDFIPPNKIFALAMNFLYQVFVVLILLNLLIAIMNATVQRLEDRRQLYWKFVRTSIWIEFFDDGSLLPMPFSLLNYPWTLIKGLY